MTLFATVFAVIFLAELPDKTALAAMVLATRHRALPVFLGTALALTVQSAIAVAAGSLLALVPQIYVRVGSGVVFIVCGAVMWLRKPEKEETQEAAPRRFWPALATTFGVVFVAEWGDLTQIGTAALQAKYHAWAIVFCASALALWCVAALAVLLGNRAGKWLAPNVTQKVAAVVFVLIGALLCLAVV